MRKCKVCAIFDGAIYVTETMKFIAVIVDIGRYRIYIQSYTVFMGCTNYLHHGGLHLDFLLNMNRLHKVSVYSIRASSNFMYTIESTKITDTGRYRNFKQ